MSRELQALLEALRLEQQERGSLVVADEIEELLTAGELSAGDTCPLCHQSAPEPDEMLD